MPPPTSSDVPSCQRKGFWPSHTAAFGSNNIGQCEMSLSPPCRSAIPNDDGHTPNAMQFVHIVSVHNDRCPRCHRAAIPLDSKCWDVAVRQGEPNLTLTWLSCSTCRLACRHCPIVDENQDSWVSNTGQFGLAKTYIGAGRCSTTIPAHPVAHCPCPVVVLLSPFRELLPSLSSSSSWTLSSLSIVTWQHAQILCEVLSPISASNHHQCPTSVVQRSTFNVQHCLTLTQSPALLALPIAHYRC